MNIKISDKELRSVVREVISEGFAIRNDSFSRSSENFFSGYFRGEPRFGGTKNSALTFSSKREADKKAREMGLQNYTIVKV